MPAEQKRSTNGPRPVADDLAGLVYRGSPLQVLRVEVAEAIRRAADGRPDTIRRVLPIVGLSAAQRTAIANHAGDDVPRGALAAHAVALASVALLDELSSWLVGSEHADQAPNWRDREWQSFGVLAVSIEAASRAMVADAGAVDWAPFLLVGMPQTLAGLGTHASAHHAVRAVLREVWSRVRYALQYDEFLFTDETWGAAVHRLQGQGAARLRSSFAWLRGEGATGRRVKPDWRETELPAMRWPAWPGVRNLLEAEAARLAGRQDVAKVDLEGGPRKAKRRQSAEARVLGELARDPDRTDAAIADAAGVARTSLYRFAMFKKARKVARLDGAERRPGHHDGRDAIDDRPPLTDGEP